MNKNTAFKQFLGKIEKHDPALVEAVKTAFNTIYESSIGFNLTEMPQEEDELINYDGSGGIIIKYLFGNDEKAVKSTFPQYAQKIGDIDPRDVLLGIAFEFNIEFNAVGAYRGSYWEEAEPAHYEDATVGVNMKTADLVVFDTADGKIIDTIEIDPKLIPADVNMAQKVKQAVLNSSEVTEKMESRPD